MPGHPLATAFLHHLPSGFRHSLKASAALESCLSEHLIAARAAWPVLTFGNEPFLRHLAERLPQQEEPLEALRRLHAADLFLARACLENDREAIGLLERSFLRASLRKALAAKGASPAEADEILQKIRIKLLFSGEGKPPKLAEYSGSGPLASWLRVLAARMVLDVRRRRKAEPADLSLSDLPVSEADPLSALVAQRYHRELKAAFQAAVAGLPRKERTLLKLHHLEGVSLDSLGAIYHADRATVARWLARSRRAIIGETRRQLVEQHRINDSDVDSLIRGVQSGLDFSLRRILGKSEG